MPLHVEVFGASRNTLVRGQGQGAVVVFKDSAADGGSQVFFVVLANGIK
jgi:hypothetical protein